MHDLKGFSCPQNVDFLITPSFTYQVRDANKGDCPSNVIGDCS
jgi:hypothetical protein